MGSSIAGVSALGKPILVMRRERGPPEAVEAGAVRIAETEIEGIVKEVGRLLPNDAAYEWVAQAIRPYEDRHAAERIVSSILEAAGHPARDSFWT